MIRRIITIITLCAGCLVTAGAQTFTERLVYRTAAGAKVTVTHSQQIDSLVNGAQPEQHTTPQQQSTATPQTPPTTNRTSVPSDDEKADTIGIDTRKKVMRGAYKVNGYRVQVFAGGNQRKDRIKAEQTGSDVKQHFPDQPVYVHFHSPRWICRIGNFRTYEEAHQVLVGIRKLGYESAIIVKGKITVYP